MLLTPGWIHAQGSESGPVPFASSDQSVGAPSIAPGERGLGLEVSAAYGYVDSEPGDQRLVFAGRLDGRPTDDLALRGTFRTRLDLVEGDSVRSTLSGDFGLTYGHWVIPELAIGASIDASFGGGDFFELDFGASQIVGRLGLVYRWAGSGAALSFDIGYLHDRSSEIVPDGSDPSPGDRVALMVDEYDALTMRLGVGLGRGAVRGWVMVDASPRLGADESLNGSLRLLGGALGSFRPSLGWSAFASVSLTPSPSVESMAPLRAVPARFGVGVALRYDPFGPRRVSTLAEPEPEPAPEPEPEPEPEPVFVAPPPTRTLAGVVEDDLGYPLEGATVHYQAGDMEGTLQSADDGSFGVEGLPITSIEVEIRAEDFEVIRVSVPVGEGESVRARMVPLTPESQLRGLVRGSRGAPLPARVRISGRDEILRADAEGRFRVELPRGDYVVEIRADGYRSQRRRVHVEEGGVTVLNVELRRAR